MSTPNTHERPDTRVRLDAALYAVAGLDEDTDLGQHIATYTEAHAALREHLDAET